jgi:hypothetical protein
MMFILAGCDVDVADSWTAKMNFVSPLGARGALFLGAAASLMGATLREWWLAERGHEVHLGLLCQCFTFDSGATAKLNIMSPRHHVADDTVVAVLSVSHHIGL